MGYRKLSAPPRHRGQKDDEGPSRFAAGFEPMASDWPPRIMILSSLPGRRVFPSGSKRLWRRLTVFKPPLVSI